MRFLLMQMIHFKLSTSFTLPPHSRLLFSTRSQLLLSRGLYWKIKYISRLQYLWEDIKKGDAEIPEILQDHDDVLEHRHCGIEPDPLKLTTMTFAGYPFGRFEEGWSSREYMSWWCKVCTEQLPVCITST